MKRIIVVLALVAAFVAVPLSAKDKGDVDKPQNLAVLELTDTDITFDWDDVADAEKYSLDIEGIIEVTVPGDPDPIVVEVDFDVSYSSVESQVTISLEDLHLDLEAAIAEAIADAEIVDGEIGDVTYLIAKVKGLDPLDKGDKKNQDNPFSDPIDLLPHPEL